MVLLILGVALWWAAHLFKRVAPERRAAMGDKGKILVAILLVLSVLLMAQGYQRAPAGPVWWGPSPALVGINNLLLLLAFYLYAADGMGTRVTTWVRHPQLTGFSLWAVAHILTNGDLPSLILFGGLLVWALVEIALLTRAGAWKRRTGPFPARKEIMAAAGAVVVMLVVGLIHGWIGPWPFGG